MKIIRLGLVLLASLCLVSTSPGQELQSNKSVDYAGVPYVQGELPPFDMHVLNFGRLTKVRGITTYYYKDGQGVPQIFLSVSWTLRFNGDGTKVFTSNMLKAPTPQDMVEVEKLRQQKIELDLFEDNIAVEYLES